MQYRRLFWSSRHACEIRGDVCFLVNIKTPGLELTDHSAGQRNVMDLSTRIKHYCSGQRNVMDLSTRIKHYCSGQRNVMDLSTRIKNYCSRYHEPLCRHDQTGGELIKREENSTVPCSVFLCSADVNRFSVRTAGVYTRHGADENMSAIILCWGLVRPLTSDWGGQS